MDPQGVAPKAEPELELPPTPQPAVPRKAEPVPRWREVAAKAAVESDPHRLSQLVDELIQLLDEERRNKAGSE